MFTGIISYEYDQKAGRFVFTLGSNLYWFEDKPSTQSMSPHLPNKLDKCSQFPKINPQICPKNADLVAYVADNDIWCCNLISGVEVRLTQSRDNLHKKVNI